MDKERAKKTTSDDNLIRRAMSLMGKRRAKQFTSESQRQAAEAPLADLTAEERAEKFRKLAKARWGRAKK